ncbi:hypothetical protein ABZ313_35730 [Streptomyces sp. NPDC006251]|uniref:hypothetical protein n=1 Tax=Streptomyces sp. NPDC006251 TaxID=3155718 RepID=UPI0033A7C1BF
MPLFPQDEIDAACHREAERDASLRATTAGELRSWFASQDDVAEADIQPATPDTVALRLADGVLITVTVSTDDGPPAPCGAEAAAHQALAGRIRGWLAGESGIGQAWSIPSTSAVGVELVDGTAFTVIVSSRM